MSFTFGLLKGALLGGTVALIGSVLVLTVAGAFAGQGLFYGLAGALYYSGILCLYVCPIGLLVGAVIASIRIVRRSTNTSEHGRRASKLTYTLGLGIPLLVIAGLVIIPYKFTNIDTVVTHGAKWTTSTDPALKCSTPVVILVLFKYRNYEQVCSAELLSYLEAEGDTIVPVQYRVTSDFGEPRGYQLIRVGTVNIDGRAWIGGGSGCGGQNQLSCNDPQAYDNSLLTTSSWPEDATREADISATATVPVRATPGK